MFIPKREVAGVLCSMLVFSTAYADDTTSSVPIGSKGTFSSKISSHDVKVDIDSSLKGQDLSANIPKFAGIDHVDWNILGRKVSSVAFIGEKNVPTAMFLNEFSLRPGKLIEHDDVIRDLQAVYMSGFYKNVELRHVTQPDGSEQLIFEVFELPVLRSVASSGTQMFTTEQLTNSLGVPIGHVANLRTIGENLSKITDMIHDNDYSLFNLVSFELSDSGDLNLEFTDGIVDGFEYQGNNHTKEYVIRRELLQPLGKPLNMDLLRGSGTRLQNLGIFDMVDFQLVPSEQNPGHVVVRVLLEEGNNATIGLGVGYSDLDKASAQLTIEDKNLFGKNHHARLTWEWNSETWRNYDFMYHVPHIDKKGTSFQVNFYDGVHEAAEYHHSGAEIARFHKRSLGQEISFSRADTPVTRNTVTLKNRKDFYNGPVSGYDRQYFEDSFNNDFYRMYGYFTTAEERRKANFGVTRSIAFSRVFDNRDSSDFPTSGKRNEYTMEWAGFGGDFKFFKLSADHRYYWRAGAKGKHTLAFGFGAGYAWGDLPLSQRFSVGGASSLRGYENGQFRGNSMLKASLEYRIPVSKKFSFLGFVDAGYAWDSKLEKERNFHLRDIKFGYGVGIRVKTPVGPVRLDYGFGKREPGQHYRGRFHFSFGGNF